MSAIVLDTKAASHQVAAAEAAVGAGLDVFYDPATERCAASGFLVPRAPYGRLPIDVQALASNARAREQLIAQVLEAHPDAITVVTPPHFLVHDERSASLNVALAADTQYGTDHPVRATLILDRRYGVRAASELAVQYAEAGVASLEIRITPLGGDDESIAKITSVFAILDAFRDVGLSLVLGLSGNIGQAAVALGHSHHYSVGIGMLSM